jgi:hypothetical protein
MSRIRNTGYKEKREENIQIYVRIRIRIRIHTKMSWVRNTSYKEKCEENVQIYVCLRNRIHTKMSWIRNTGHQEILQIYVEHLGAVCRGVPGHLHGQPGRLHDPAQGVPRPLGTRGFSGEMLKFTKLYFFSRWSRNLPDRSDIDPYFRNPDLNPGLAHMR